MRILKIYILTFWSLQPFLLVGQEMPYFSQERASNPKSRSAEEWCNFAMELYAKDQFREAIRYFDEAVRLKPDYKMAYYYRAACKEDVKDERAALTDYQICMHLDPQFSEALFSKALLNYKLENYAQAIGDFTRLLTFPKKETQTVYYQNVSYGGERVTGGIITLQSKSSEIYNYRGLAHLKQKDFIRSFADFDSAIILYQSNANYYINRGLAKLRQGDKASAIQDYEKALEISPAHPLALHNLGMIKANAKDYKNLMSFEDKFPPFYIKQGNEKLEESAFKEAVAYYDTAILLGSEDPSTFFNRGFCKEKQGDWQGAIRDFTKTIGLKKNFVKAYSSRGNVYFKQKNTNNSRVKQRAVKTFKKQKV
jgi:tetratricopeptide (TPR) repeat protein